MTGAGLRLGSRFERRSRRLRLDRFEHRPGGGDRLDWRLFERFVERLVDDGFGCRFLSRNQGRDREST